MTVAVEKHESEVVQRDYGRLLEDSYSRAENDHVQNFVPHKGTLLVKPDPPETTTKSGIHLPEVAIQQKQIGTVLAVSEDDGDYHVGDRVLFRARAGTAISFPEPAGECKLLQYCGDIDDEILGKFKNVT